MLGHESINPFSALVIHAAQTLLEPLLMVSVLDTNRYNYPRRQQEKWSSLGELPFRPTGALARSFQEVATVFWDARRHQGITALGWCAFHADQPHARDWFVHLLRCGASPWGDCGNISCRPCSSVIEFLAKSIRPVSSEGFSVCAEELLSLIQANYGLTYGQGGVSYGVMEGLLRSQRSDFLDQIADELTAAGLARQGDMQFPLLVYAFSNPEFAEHTARRLLTKGLDWNPLDQSLLSLVSLLYKGKFWLEQCCAVLDRDADQLSKGPPSGWAENLGEALLRCAPDQVALFRDALDQRIPREQRRQWAPSLPVEATAKPAWHWNKQAWESLPGLTQWAVDWGLPSAARLKSGLAWPHALMLQWHVMKPQDRTAFFPEEIETRKEACQRFRETIDLLAHAGYRIDMPVQAKHVEEARVAWGIRLEKTLPEFLSNQSLLAPDPFDGYVHRLPFLLRTMGLAQKLPSAVSTPPKPRF